MGARVRAIRLKVRAWLREFYLPLGVVCILVGSLGLWASERWYDWFEKRVVVIIPGQLVRGAFQRPDPLRRIIAREHVKTVVTLCAIGDDNERFRGQARVIQETGVKWITVPILGSRPSLEQMAQAADLLADKNLHPVFFHCVAGHHRTSLALAAYRIRHEGWSAERAWSEVCSFPWARGDADAFDHRQIENFAAKYAPQVASRGYDR